MIAKWPLRHMKVGINATFNDNIGVRRDSERLADAFYKLYRASLQPPGKHIFVNIRGQGCRCRPDTSRISTQHNSRGNGGFMFFYCHTLMFSPPFVALPVDQQFISFNLL